MSGNLRIVLDTNAVVSLLSGNHQLATLLEHAEYVGISVVSYLEFLAFGGLSERDRTCFYRFCERVEVVELAHENSELIKTTLTLRNEHRLKLPDAIIGATALCRNALLITNDTHFYGISVLVAQGC